jgi:hypothetical protein
MKCQLYIQRRKGKLLKIINSYVSDVSGGMNKDDRKLYAMDHDRLIAEMFVTDMVIGADGIMFKGLEEIGDKLYFQEWWAKV